MFMPGALHGEKVPNRYERDSFTLTDKYTFSSRSLVLTVFYTLSTTCKSCFVNLELISLEFFYLNHDAWNKILQILLFSFILKAAGLGKISLAPPGGRNKTDTLTHTVQNNFAWV